MSVTTTTMPDPRFGMDAFAVSSTTKTPAGLTRTVTTSRTASLASSTDPLTLSSLIESVTVNGRTSQSSYNGTTRRMTLTSAAGPRHHRGLRCARPRHADRASRRAAGGAPLRRARPQRQHHAGHARDTALVPRRRLPREHPRSAPAHDVVRLRLGRPAHDRDAAGPERDRHGLRRERQRDLGDAAWPPRARLQLHAGRPGIRLHASRRGPAPHHPHRLQPRPAGQQRLAAGRGLHHADLRCSEGPADVLHDQPGHDDARLQLDHRAR